MVSRSTIALSLVAVVLLTGCSGLIGDGGTAGPDSPDEFEYADGFAADGITDGENATESYRQALANVNSFTVDYQQNLSGGDSDVAYDVSYRVDVEGEQALHRVAVPSQDYEVESYYGTDQQVTREVSSGQEQVSAQDGSFNLENLNGVDAIAPLFSNTTDYETSVDERHGTSVVVYETSGAENAEAAFGVDAGNVSTFSAQFSVDSEGLVHHASYELTYTGSNGQEQTLTLTFEVVDVDGTSIERPEWVNSS